MDKNKLLKVKEDLKVQFSKQNSLNFSEFCKLKEYDIIEQSNLFNQEWYMLNYPDVKLNNMDPIEHYIKFGVNENCNPNPDFNTKGYLSLYPDVRNNGLNPFVHYILYGVHEGRHCQTPDSHIEKKYFVSIIMPTFNRVGIISRAINSVINQTFKNFELIIIDDGSDDNTEEFILNSYGSFIKKGKIIYRKLDHQGVCFARNYGLNIAKGNIIAYLDSDNQWDLKFLEIMLLELYKNTDYNCAYSVVKVFHNVNNHNYLLNSEFNRKSLLEQNFIDINCFIHEKSLYDRLGGFDQNLTRLVDWDLIIRYTKDNEPLFVNKILVNYFIDSNLNNITTSEPLGKNMSIIKNKYWHELYEEEYNAVVDIFDEEFYLEQYPDVLKSDFHPLHHFLSIGYKEGRNPNPDFITSYYTDKYPEVLNHGLNPLVHYAKWGELEGREINYFKEYNNILNNNLAFISNYSFEDNMPLVSIIILNRNGLNHLKVLFKDFSKKTNYDNFEIIVVDNASSDDSVEYLKGLNDLPIRIIENTENVSFSKGNNDAVNIAKGEYILLLNNDIEPTFGWLNEMMGTILFNDNVGAVGAKLIYPFISNKNMQKYSFTIQHAGDIFREKIKPDCIYSAHNKGKFSSNIFDKSFSFNKKCLLVTGAVLLVKKDIYLEIGGLDESFWYGYEDVDFNLRLYVAGYDVMLSSAALLFHHESATPRESSVLPYNAKVLCKKWSDFLFKKLLKDKIERNIFFTDKKLSFLLVANKNFHEVVYERDMIHNLVNYFIKEDYEIEINNDLSNLNVDGKVDILVSFIQEYDIKNVVSRNNLIKLLLLTRPNDLSLEKYDNWDIVIIKDDNFESKFKKDDEWGFVYYIHDFNDLGEKIISILYDFFLLDE